MGGRVEWLGCYPFAAKTRPGLRTLEGEYSPLLRFCPGGGLNKCGESQFEVQEAFWIHAEVSIALSTLGRLHALVLREAYRTPPFFARQPIT